MKNELKSLVRPSTLKAFILAATIILIEALEFTTKITINTLKALWEMYSGSYDYSSEEHEDSANVGFNTTQNPYQ